MITQLAVYGFDEASKRLKLLSLHPGISLSQVQDSSSFEIMVPDKIETSYVPTEEDLRILRQEIDPSGMVLGK